MSNLSLETAIRETSRYSGSDPKPSSVATAALRRARWVEKKHEWSRLKAEKLESFRSNGASNWWQQYIAWHEAVASSYEAAIDAAYVSDHV